MQYLSYIFYHNKASKKKSSSDIKKLNKSENKRLTSD